MSLRQQLEERIKTSGTISVAEYMEACVTHYYATRDPFGKSGDFTTAPEISQVFGELIGAWLAVQWQAMGSPVCTLLELGPGRGTLMHDILRATQSVPGFHANLHINLLEISPALVALQRKTLKNHRAHWLRNLDALPSLPLLFVANEFFDALPVRQFVGDQERRVDAGFRFVPGGEVTHETCEAGEAIMKNLAAHIARFGGAGLVIDYGYAEGAGDTLQAVKEHKKAGPLENPGEADLTAHVDFAALAAAAHAAKVYGPVPQGTFLKRLGAELRAAALCKNATAEQQHTILSGLERLVAPQEMGELFKVLAICHPDLPAPEGFK